MDDNNRQLLSEVVQKKLNQALNCSADDENYNQVFKDAMVAVDKQLELDKIDTSYQEHWEKLDVEKAKFEAEKERFEAEKAEHIRKEEFEKEEAIKSRYVQIGIFAAGLIITPIAEYIVKGALASKIGKIEQFETYTSSAGRSISSWFRLKK